MHSDLWSLSDKKHETRNPGDYPCILNGMPLWVVGGSVSCSLILPCLWLHPPLQYPCIPLCSTPASPSEGVPCCRLLGRSALTVHLSGQMSLPLYFLTTQSTRERMLSQFLRSCLFKSRSPWTALFHLRHTCSQPRIGQEAVLHLYASSVERGNDTRDSWVTLCA